MIEVLQAFVTIFVLVGAGVFVRSSGIVSDRTHTDLGRLAFHLLVPVLLFQALANTDVADLWSRYQAAAVGTWAAALAATLLTCAAFRRSTRTAVAIGLTANYPNAVNVGIPVALQLFGGIGYITPLLLVELLMIVPISLCAFELSAATGSPMRALGGLIRNPLLWACGVGLTWSAFELSGPTFAKEPLAILSGATIPVVLLAFGMSLVSERPFAEPERVDTVIATTGKLVLTPCAAFLVGSAFGLTAEPLFALVILSALPSAQNAYIFAQRYGQSATGVRDAVLTTTALSAPAMLAVVALLR